MYIDLNTMNVIIVCCLIYIIMFMIVFYSVQIKKIVNIYKR